MNFLELQARALSWLDDVDQGYFTPTQLNPWINNAQKEVQKLLLDAGQNFYMKPVTTQLVASQQDYVLPIDFVVLHRLEVVISGTQPNESVSPLTPITTNQRDLVQTGLGTPLCYSLKRNRITLYPTPDAALTLRLYYSPVVLDMVADNDMPNVPDQYQEMISLLAAQDGFIKDERISDLLLKKLGEYQARLKNLAQERQQDQSRSIVETGNSIDNNFFW